jgi:hypothetical protein
MHACSCPSGVVSGPASALSSNPIDPRQLTSHHGSQHSYSSADMCAAPARTFSYGPTYLHTAVLTGLVPRQRHFYQIEGGEPIEFTASVETGPTHRFSFLIFGDMGEGRHRAAKSPGCASRAGKCLRRSLCACVCVRVGDKLLKQHRWLIGAATCHVCILHHDLQSSVPVALWDPSSLPPAHCHRHPPHRAVAPPRRKPCCSASRTMQLLEDEVGAGAELIMHVGDISYANGREEVRPCWSVLPCCWLTGSQVTAVQLDTQFPVWLTGRVGRAGQMGSKGTAQSMRWRSALAVVGNVAGGCASSSSVRMPHHRCWHVLLHLCVRLSISNAHAHARTMHVYLPTGPHAASTLQPCTADLGRLHG